MENIEKILQDVIVNQQTIISNQEGLLHNQKTITGNQEVIVSNQASIISNQHQIVDNQVALSVISQTQSHMLNLLKKLAGQEETHETTVQFLDKLKADTEASIKQKGLNEPQAI